MIVLSAEVAARLAAAARRAIAVEGEDYAAVPMVVPRRWTNQRRMQVWPGLWGEPVQEVPRGVVVLVKATDILDWIRRRAHAQTPADHA
jgi:hypothetical protein